MAVNSISALQALNPATTTYETVLGYDTPGDGGGGDFYWDSASGQTADDGIIFTSTYPGVTSGRWIRIFSGDLNVRWFGAKGDGITNDTARIQAAFNQPFNVFFPKGIYRTTYGLRRGQTQETGYPIIMDTDALIKPEFISRRYTALTISPRAFSTGWNINVDTQANYFARSTTQPAIDGILFEYCTALNITALRVNALYGYGIRFNRMFDTIANTISVEKCGTDTSYAIGFYTANNNADSVNESFIARLQVERAYKRAIYTHFLTLNVHFGVIHSERVFADSSITTWDFSGANCMYDNMRLTTSKEAVVNNVESTVDGRGSVFLNGENTIYNNIRVEDDLANGGKIFTYLKVQDGNIMINNLGARYVECHPDHNSPVIINRLNLGDLKMMDIPGTILKGGNVDNLTILNKPWAEGILRGYGCTFENVNIQQMLQSEAGSEAVFIGCRFLNYTGFVDNIIVDNCVFINEANFEYTPYFEIRNSLFKSNLKLNFYSEGLRFGKLINSHVQGNLINSWTASGLLNSGSTVNGTVTANLQTAPTLGTWAKGDRHYRITPTLGQPKSWVRTAAGSFASEGSL